MRIRGAGTAGAGLLLVAATLTGCAQSQPHSSGSPSSASASPSASAIPSASASADVCGDARALQQSIADVQDLNVVASGTDAAKRDLRQVQQDLERLIDAARTQSASAVARIESDVAAIQSSLGTAGATPSPSTVAEVRREISTLDQDTRTLIGEVTTGC